LSRVNDIHENINGGVRTFAQGRTPNLSEPRLYTINKWAITWLVSYNTLKTEAMLFSPGHAPVQLELNLVMDNTPVKFVEDHKHLGLIFNNKSINST
jgi:gentisate 1,2-dioxygenase